MQTRSQTRSQSKTRAIIEATPVATSTESSHIRQYLPYVIDFACNAGTAINIACKVMIGLYAIALIVLFGMVAYDKVIRYVNMHPYDANYSEWHWIFFRNQNEFVANPKHVYDFIDFAESIRMENEPINDLYERCINLEEALPLTYMLYGGRFVDYHTLPTYHDLTHHCPNYTKYDLIAIVRNRPADWMMAECTQNTASRIFQCHDDIMKSIREKCAWYNELSW